MNPKKIYSVIGIGIGPFNLGLAALLEPVNELSSLFFDQSEEFNWHPGLMLDSATLQTPFLCDCVSMADPTSHFSFLNFMKQTGRLYKFFIRENFFVLRKEYNAYCKWVAGQLPNCRFSHQVKSVIFEDGLYQVSVLNLKTKETTTHFAKKLALGTGTRPDVPDFVKKADFQNVIHTSAYLNRKAEMLESGSVTIIGSGQSAAEVFYDLLPQTKHGLQLNWFTRPDRFFPMEYSKLSLELTSPEYIDYFYNMPAAKRKQMLTMQKSLFKGISFDLINQIYDLMYEMTVGDEEISVQLRPNIQLDHINAEADDTYTLELTHVDQQKTFYSTADFVVLGTGYTYHEPEFLQGIKDRISRSENGLYAVNRNYTIDHNASEIFVQNAESHTHSFISTDLGMGAYRNSIIINQLAEREVYKVEERIAYQEFGLEKSPVLFNDLDTVIL